MPIDPATRWRLKWRLLLLLAGSPVITRAQVNSDAENFSHSHSHFRFGASALLCNRAQYSSASGDYRLSSKVQLRYQIEANLVIPISLSWSLVTGAELGVIGWTYLLTLPAYSLDSSQNYSFANNGAATRMKDIFLCAFLWDYPMNLPVSEN